MSRIGRMPVTVPAGVTVTVDAGNVVTLKGKNGTLTEKFPEIITVKQEGATVVVERPDDEKETKALHGLCRALLNNMVVGVSEGFSKTLEIVGVGYKVVKQGKELQLYLGHSLMPEKHPRAGLPQAKFVFVEPEGITFEVPNSNTIVVKGASKQQVGQIAAEIRSKRPPEPYLGKGVKYQGEVIRRKAGKTGK